MLCGLVFVVYCWCKNRGSGHSEQVGLISRGGQRLVSRGGDRGGEPGVEVGEGN